jgi:hypothetical protein
MVSGAKVADDSDAELASEALPNSTTTMIPSPLKHTTTLSQRRRNRQDTPTALWAGDYRKGISPLTELCLLHNDPTLHTGTILLAFRFFAAFKFVPGARYL